ncbi:hypothetical protein Scep_005004 [Stephania cephalantha]|uniref:Ethylene-insensitive protein 2 n=1 Tax=Stephania cephalantha TaxID=152367 RepID=A0AAP0KW10_9MAGN
MEYETGSLNQRLALASRLLPVVGPVLLISVGYIDPGKWSAVVDGGARFGYDLVLLMLVFNCIAILCHYMAAAIGVVTGKNLAQICSEEYNKCTCLLLGVQAELSLIVTDLSVVLGMAHGFNLLFGVNMATCLLFTISDIVLFPFILSFLEKYKAEAFLVSTSGLILVCYVLGVLISQSDISLMNGLPTKLSAENLFAIMSLLGANITPHNFYIHSSIVQRQKGSASIPKNALCHEHFFAILCVFSGISLVNYAMMNSAATVFHSDGHVVLTFQDIMDQIVRNPVAIFALFLLLLISNEITSLTCKLGGQVVLRDFFKVDPPVWLHRAAIRTFVIVVALYSTWNSGSEWIYQLLIFTQVVLAILLPSSMILLIRVASSRSIMGLCKIPPSLEFLAFATLICMIGLNIVFTTEMLCGSSDWVSNLQLSMGSNVTFPYVLLLTISFASLALMLWLVATPLKSASVRSDSQIWGWDLKESPPEVSVERVEHDAIKSKYQEEEPIVEDVAVAKSVGSYSDNSNVEYDVDLPETILDSDQEVSLPVVSNDLARSQSSQVSHREGAELTPLAIVDKEVAGAGLLQDVDAYRKTESVDSVEKTGSVEGESQTEKDDDETDSWEAEEPRDASRIGPTSTSEGPGSFRSLSVKSDEGGNGNGSLSRLSGLGRAARRQLAAILDEFWGQLYDFHGNTTQDAKMKKFDLLFGLDVKLTSVALKVSTGVTGSSGYFPSVSEAGSAFVGNSGIYESPSRHRMTGTAESPYGYQAVSSMWSTRTPYLDGYLQKPSNNVLDPVERRYSSLRLPTSSEDLDHQPRTVHGYQLASYLTRMSTDRNSDASNSYLDSPTPKSQSSAFAPANYRDPLSYTLGQNLQNRASPLHSSAMHNPAISRARELQAERPYNDQYSSGAGESFNTPANTKKYHSLPDISGLAVPRRSPYENRNSQWKGPPGFEPTAYKAAYEKSMYSTTGSRAQTLLVFDEQPSPSKHYRDSLSTQLIPNSDAKSLWSKQPFEQLFGVAGNNCAVADGVSPHEPFAALPEAMRMELEKELLQSFRSCIIKILKLEGCEWLFRLNGGADEDLIDRVAARERLLYEADSREPSQVGRVYESQFLSTDRRSGGALRSQEAGYPKFLSYVPHCDEGCVWQTSLIVSFGVWCIHRILELSLMESRPELWGKYTYVLNRLQGILEHAFFRPRFPLPPCLCLQIPAASAKRLSPTLINGLLPPAAKPGKGKCTSASTLLDLIKDVETAVSCRKGRTGTAAGEVAFPKGKENLASVLKRYKRRLSNKSAGAHDNVGSGPRKVPSTLTSYNP